jgi:tRNA nucleotidyltransferase (CCA-adding enzyme)
MKLGPKEPYDPKNPEHNDPKKYKLYLGNVFNHVIAALRANKLKDPILNLAVLFHDVGKINTFALSDSGKNTYYGHAKESMNIIDQIADRMKLDNKTRKALIFTAGYHMHMHDFFKMSNSKITKLIQDDNWDLLYNLGMLDDKARMHLFSQKNWDNILDKVKDLTNKYKDAKAQEELRKIVNGEDVMKIKNMKPSKEVGLIIKQTIDWIQDNNINLNDISKIHQYIKNI